jgi:hypothetical protein
VDVIFDTKQASVSMLQRRLKLGYSRAARLVDQMEEMGIVGPFEGSKPRQVLMTKEQWQEMQLVQGTAPTEVMEDAHGIRRGRAPRRGRQIYKFAGRFFRPALPVYRRLIWIILTPKWKYGT